MTSHCSWEEKKERGVENGVRAEVQAGAFEKKTVCLRGEKQFLSFQAYTLLYLLGRIKLCAWSASRLTQIAIML